MSDKLTDYMEDQMGRLVPIAQVREIDQLRDELVKQLTRRARGQQRDLKLFKDGVMDDIAAFVQLSAERYDVHLGGDKGNVTLYSYDGRFKVVRSISEQLTFDEGLAAGKALIDECLREWMDGAPTALRAVVDQAFKVNKEGRINTNAILGLRRLEISDERWLRAMKAISDAIRVQCSKSYVRMYERDQQGRYIPISLDIASL